MTAEEGPEWGARGESVEPDTLNERASCRALQEEEGPRTDVEVTTRSRVEEEEVKEQNGGDLGGTPASLSLCAPEPPLNLCFAAAVLRASSIVPTAAAAAGGKKAGGRWFEGPAFKLLSVKGLEMDDGDDQVSKSQAADILVKRWAGDCLKGGLRQGGSEIGRNRCGRSKCGAVAG